MFVVAAVVVAVTHNFSPLTASQLTSDESVTAETDYCSQTTTKTNYSSIMHCTLHAVYYDLVKNVTFGSCQISHIIAFSDAKVNNRSLMLPHETK